MASYCKEHGVQGVQGHERDEKKEKNGRIISISSDRKKICKQSPPSLLCLRHVQFYFLHPQQQDQGIIDQKKKKKKKTSNLITLFLAKNKNLRHPKTNPPLSLLLYNLNFGPKKTNKKQPTHNAKMNPYNFTLPHHP